MFFYDTVPFVQRYYQTKWAASTGRCCFLCMLCPALSCSALPSMLCPALPCFVLPCHVLSCPALPCLALPCSVLPCPALPCPALPCHVLSCLPLPCPMFVYAIPLHNTHSVQPAPSSLTLCMACKLPALNTIVPQLPLLSCLIAQPTPDTAVADACSYTLCDPAHSSQPVAVFHIGKSHCRMMALTDGRSQCAWLCRCLCVDTLH